LDGAATSAKYFDVARVIDAKSIALFGDRADRLRSGPALRNVRARSVVRQRVRTTIRTVSRRVPARCRRKFGLYHEGLQPGARQLPEGVPAVLAEPLMGADAVNWRVWLA